MAKAQAKTVRLAPRKCPVHEFNTGNGVNLCLTIICSECGQVVPFEDREKSYGQTCHKAEICPNGAGSLLKLCEIELIYKDE